MNRKQYLSYLLRRIAEAAVIAGAGGFAIHLAQSWGWITPARHYWAYRAINWSLPHLGQRHWVEPAGWFLNVAWYTYPVCAGLVTHILFGPKQERPIYMRVPGFSFIYGRVKSDRNATCRGGFISGATGSGKSQICINPLLHSVTINEAGTERKSWARSKARPLLERARARFRTANKTDLDTVKELNVKSEEAQEAARSALDELVASLLVNVLEWQAVNPGQPFTPQVAGILAADLNDLVGLSAQPPPGAPPHIVAAWKRRQADRKAGKTVTIDRGLIVSLFDRLETLQRLESPASVTSRKANPYQETYNLYRNRLGDAQECDEQIASILARMSIRRLEFQKFADPLKPLRYLVPPWGGLVADEKGNQWQTVTAMFAHYNRDEDLMLLQTRPADAPEDWLPPARFNVLSFDNLPADTYAKLIVDTGLAIEGGDKPDEFFVPQARDKIGWGLKLMRAVREAQIEIGEQPERMVYPAIDKILNFLTTLTNYNAFLLEVGAAPSTNKVATTRTIVKKDPNGIEYDEAVTVEEEVTTPARLNTPALREARARLENDYWQQPDDQRGGVASTIYNFLVPFTEPDVAAVFCRDNTFDLRAVNNGKVVSVALPQKYAVQRRYVTAILKTIMYQLVQNRFDLRSDQTAWSTRNLIMLPQDEFQRYAIEADTQVDTIREAQGTTYAAAQTQDAVWRSYGGKEKAVPMLANLRTRFICTAATESCAEESSRLIGKYTSEKHSFSSGKSGGGSNTSFEDRYFIKPHELMSMPAFYVLLAPAESRYLYLKMIVMPVTPDGKTPPWWFGDWNPLAWVHLAKSKTGKGIIWPWRARAPFRAQLRYLLGFDGTFILVEKLTRWKARRMNHKGK